MSDEKYNDDEVSDRMGELFALVGEYDYDTKDLKATNQDAYIAELERRLNLVGSFARRAYLMDDFSTPISEQEQK